MLSESGVQGIFCFSVSMFELFGMQFRGLERAVRDSWLWGERLACKGAEFHPGFD